MTLWARVFQRLLFAVYRQRVVVLLFLLIAVSAGTYYLWLERTNLPTEAQAAGTDAREVTVQDLEGTINNATLTLQEKNGTHRRISMAVGTSEALAIAKDRGNTQIPPDQQPQAYSLMKDAIQEMGGHVDRVIVNDANQNQYLAQIVLTDGGDTKVIKARPGDAIALALQTGAPIFVEDKVLDQFGTKGSG